MKRILSKIGAMPKGMKGMLLGLLVGAVVPLILWVALRRILWPLVILGGLVLAASAVVYGVEKRQGFDSAHFGDDMRRTVPFDPDRQVAVIRASICTGEKVAGFKNKADGHFTEVMLIRSPRDEERFMEIYHLDTVRTEY